MKNLFDFKRSLFALGLAAALLAPVAASAASIDIIENEIGGEQPNWSTCNFTTLMPVLRR